MPSLATILVGAAVAALIGSIIYRMVMNKKRNPNGCCGSCSGCPSAGGQRECGCPSKKVPQK